MGLDLKINLETTERVIEKSQSLDSRFKEGFDFIWEREGGRVVDLQYWSRMWNGNGNAAVQMAVRYFSSSARKRAPNLRKINPRVTFQEAACIAEDLYGVIKAHGPVTIGNAWNHVKVCCFSILIYRLIASRFMANFPKLLIRVAFTE